MKTRPALLILFAAAALNCCYGDKTLQFTRDIKPILADKCYACHGPDAGQRKADLRLDIRDGAFAKRDNSFAIVAGKPGESALVTRIMSKDDDLRMPPSDHPKQLTDVEKKKLVNWIEQGAKWEEHWAYLPPKRYAAPKTNDSHWPRNFIDSFLLHTLEQRKLKPSRAASPTTLIRRLSFDLTGLPPSPETVQRFQSRYDDTTYEDIVNELLNSPHYGERMAMYWLDLVRYADTVGYHGDQDMSVSPFRDYVINAFNNNMPFDQFTREQLAGDLFAKPTQSQLIASGYNKLGMMSAEGGVQPKEYLAKYAADRVRTASSVWMGSTLGCAECHDHKFDPFTTRDFYRFEAFFADIKERGLYSGANRTGDWGPRIDVADPTLPSILKPIDDEIAKLEKALATSTPELEKAQLAWENKTASTLVQWHPLRVIKATALHKVVLKTTKDRSVLATGPSPPQNTYTLTAKTKLKRITGFRIEVLPHKSLPAKGPGRAGNGNFVLTEMKLRSIRAGKSTPLELSNPSASIEQTAAGNITPYGKWSALSAVDKDVKGNNWGWAILPAAGKANELVVQTALDKSDEQEFVVVLEQNHDNPGHTLGRFRLSVTDSSTPARAKGSDKVPGPIRAILAIDRGQRSGEQKSKLSDWFRRNVAKPLSKTRAELAKRQKQRSEVVKSHTRTTLITVAVKPRPIRVLPRGNWMDNSGEIVQPGVPHFLRQISLSKKRATRADLAEWLTSRDNPLTARVFVNRLWKLYFGNGLSKVLDDVGSQGEPPLHPELLDTLAVEFMESGWNVKHVVKLLVTSTAYRQSSLMRKNLRDVDPYNRLMARQSRFRLDAEMVRDNALAVSGLLNRKIGGRSVKPYQPAGLYRHLNFPRRTYKHDNGPDQYRRGLYTHWQRQFLHPAMKAFDAPAREECTAERARSNTPLSALVLLNDPSFVEAARSMAQEVMARHEDTTSRIDVIMQTALSRAPVAQERAVIQQLYASLLKEYQGQPDEADKLLSVGQREVPGNLPKAELAAWTSIARVIFNMHEFITRN